MCKSFPYGTFDNTMSTKLFPPLLAMIASATDRELAKQVQYLKEENKILRARIPGQIHTKPAERERLLRFRRLLSRKIAEKHQSGYTEASYANGALLQSVAKASEN